MYEMNNFDEDNVTNNLSFVLASTIEDGRMSDAGTAKGGGKTGDALEFRLKDQRDSRWWHFLLLFLLVIGGGVLFIFLFSGMPHARGDDLFAFLSDYYKYSFIAGGAAVCVTLFLIMLDIRFWTGAWQHFATGLVFLIVVLFGVAAVLAIKEFYVVPIGYFLLGSPFLLMVMRGTVFHRMGTIHFMSTLSTSLFFQAVVVGSLWVAWLVVERKWWDVETKVEFYQRMRCNTTALPENLLQNPDKFIPELSSKDRAELDSMLMGCTFAFMLWISPCLLGIWSFVFSVVLVFLTRMLLDARAERNTTKALDSIAQAFIMVVGLGLFGLWAAAGLAGAEMNLSNVILSLGFVAMVVTGVVVVAVFGAAAMQEGLANTALGSKVIENMGSDWAKAILLILLLPFFLLYLCVALFTQCSRKTLDCTKTLEDDERRLFFTARAETYITWIKKWNWTSVLVKCHWLAILFFLLSVGVVRVTTLFLSWLNEALAPLSLALTTTIFFAVGISMFLNPFIPGVPVYLSGGIILVASAEKDLGFWGGVLYTIGICFCLKMLAIVCQQKLIGEMWAGKKTWIRKMVGVNSIDIRAIRYILMQPGISFRKVTILCGGPDWPVSVLTGILRLDVWSMLFASTPIIFLIAPTVVAGALLLRAADGGIWSSLSTLTMAITVVVQSGAMLAAVHYIAVAIIEKEEELNKIPPDQEVLDLEHKERKRMRLRVHVSHWKHINPVMKALLAISAIMITASCYLFQLLGSRCFTAFEVSDSIAVELEGNILKLVKPLGWVGLGIFLIPCVLLFIFFKYVGFIIFAELKRNPSCKIEGVDGEEEDVENQDDDSVEQDPKQRTTRRICVDVFCCIKK